MAGTRCQADGPFPGVQGTPWSCSRHAAVLGAECRPSPRARDEGIGIVCQHRQDNQHHEWAWLERGHVDDDGLCGVCGCAWPCQFVSGAVRRWPRLVANIYAVIARSPTCRLRLRAHRRSWPGTGLALAAGASAVLRPSRPASGALLLRRGKTPSSSCFVADRLATIPITCCLDGQAHDVTDESVAAGQHTGGYEALCGYVVLPAAMVAPVGRRCARCIAVSVPAHQRIPTTGPARRPRRGQRGWLWRLLHPGRMAGAGARWLS